MVLLRNMKIKIIFSILIFINAIDNIYAGKINEEKSFDQIFGQKWDEKEEENGGNETDQNGRIIGQTNGLNEAKNGKNIAKRLFAEQFDQNLQVKQESSTNCDKIEQLGINFEQISDQFTILNNQIKREIVEKFDKIKEKIKQMGKKYSKKEWNKIETKIVQKLGTNREKIYKWKREFGLIKKNYYSYEEKRKILKRFYQIYGKIKIKLSEKLDRKKEKCQKIIAKHLGIDISSIYRWNKQLKDGYLVKNPKIDEQKREIIEKYFKIKNEFLQNGRHSQQEWNEFKAKIKQMFGVSHMTIERWAKKFDINGNAQKERKFYSIAAKFEMMEKYNQIKEQNTMLTEYEISKILNIPRSTLSYFKNAMKKDNKI